MTSAICARPISSVAASQPNILPTNIARVSGHFHVRTIMSGMPKGFPLLPTDSSLRKETPISTGFLKYFPRAAAYAARISVLGNEKHNPGEELHWAEGKSMDHPDCIARHLIEADTFD